MEPPLAQILVVVANIRMRSWMTEVEEGFVSTAVEHELANPKLHGNPDSQARPKHITCHRAANVRAMRAKGNPVTIPEPVEYTFDWPSAVRPRGRCNHGNMNPFLREANERYRKSFLFCLTAFTHRPWKSFIERYGWTRW